MIPLFSLTAQKVRFTGAGRLFDRPQAIYQMLFERQGLQFEQTPEGITIFGRLRPGGFTLPGDVSSQFISGLLFAAPLMESESSIEVLAPYESRSYVDMTVDAMQQFGVKVASRARKNGSVMYRVAAPQRYTASDFSVEGDYSQAAFLAVLGCVIGGITVTGLNPDSQQGDKVILDILKRCGGKFKPVEGGLHFDRSLLKATEIDLADCPDLGPILFTLGCFCSGETVIRNAGRLRLKESDRAHPGRGAPRAERTAVRPQRPPHRHGAGRGGDCQRPARPALRGRGRGQELARVLERAARSWRQGGAEHRQTRRI